MSVPQPPSIPLSDTTSLKRGDVVQISLQLTDAYGKPYWWKRFAVVVEVAGKDEFCALNLKMQLDPDKDERWVTFERRQGDKPQVVTKLPEPWPQGVNAIMMKYITTGVFKLEGEG